MRIIKGIFESLKDLIEFFIFASKWMLIPFYFYLFYTLFNLMVALVNHGHINNELLISTLEAVDVVMIANLVKMIITGSYNSFVSKTHNETTEKVGSGLLKVKMATSIVGVSSIHLLQTFIASGTTDWETIWKQIAIHMAFVVGGLVLAFIDLLHHKGEALEHSHNSTH